jgi:hypothetical protein
VTGTFVIDPTLYMPRTLLRPKWAGHELNLSLNATGDADVDVYLVAGGRQQVANSKTRLWVVASNNVVVRLVSMLGSS